MQRPEYRVIPAPTRGTKAPGRKTPEERFAHAIEAKVNEMAAQGWMYLRADILPSTERQGLTGSQTVYRTVLVFARDTAVEATTPHGPEVDEQPPREPETVLRAERGAPPPVPRDSTDLRAQAAASLDLDERTPRAEDDDDHPPADFRSS